VLLQLQTSLYFLFDKRLSCKISTLLSHPRWIFYMWAHGVTRQGDILEDFAAWVFWAAAASSFR
jgi:hypothetical protein